MKVYLSKASRAPSDLVEKVRWELFRRGVEVVQSTEPFIDHEKMLDCDRVIFVPNNPRTFEGETRTTIGKGQADQIQAWTDADKEYRSLIVTQEDIDKGGPFRLSDISDSYFKNAQGGYVTVRIVDPSDYVNYGVIEDDGDRHTVTELFGKVVYNDVKSIAQYNTPTVSGTTHLYAAVALGII